MEHMSSTHMQGIHMHCKVDEREKYCALHVTANANSHSYNIQKIFEACLYSFLTHMLSSTHADNTDTYDTQHPPALMSLR